MPKEQQDLNGNIIAIKANQTPKEITVQLDNKERREEEEEYNRLKSEFTRNSNRFTKNRSREIQGRVTEEQARESKRYILQNTFLLCNNVRCASIAGKITVQVDVNTTVAHFGGVARW